MKTCAFDGCLREVRCAGFCAGHYTQSNRGAALKPLKAREQRRARDPRPFAERFWSRVDKEGGPVHATLGRCWEWTGATTHNGYGNVSNVPWRHEAASSRAHRISWELEHGEPPPCDRQVLHRCDNRKCVRPTHLFLGDAAANSKDMAKKNRTTSPLTEQEAREILTSHEPSRTLAARFGVSQGAINSIRGGRTWRHLRESTGGASA